MSLSISELKGCTSAIAIALKSQGILDSDALLAASITPGDRKKLASLILTDTQVVLDLANRADLARINGVGGVYSDLLEEAGVDTVKELARRSAENLYAKLVEINTNKQITNRIPTEDQLANFIEQAKNLPPTLEY